MDQRQQARDPSGYWSQTGKIVPCNAAFDMWTFTGLPPFETSSDNNGLDRGDEGFADARIVNISAAQTKNCTTYPKVV